MATIVTRSGKGSPLTHGEVDSNFTNLNTDKLELSGGTMTGNLSFGDNDKAIFGAGSDLQIYHDGSNSYIKDIATGNLNIDASNLSLRSWDGAESYIDLVDNSYVQIRHNNAVKLATTSTGVDITGTLTSDGLTSSGDVTIGNGATLRIDDQDSILFGTYSGGSTGTLLQGGTSTDYITRVAGRLRQTIATNGDISFYEDTGTTAKFFWDASAESLGIGKTDRTTTSVFTVQNFNDVTTNTAEFYNDNGNRTFRFAQDTSGNADLLLEKNDGTDTVLISTHGNSYFNGGNVGIGTSSPARNLSIVDSGVPLLQLALSTDQAAGNGFELAYDGVAAYLAQRENLPMVFKTNDTERMRIASSGSVGIGTTSPTSKITLGGETIQFATALLVQETGHATSERAGIQTGGWIFGQDQAGDGVKSFFIYDANTSEQRLLIDTSGRLLVGKTSNSNSTAGTTVYSNGKIEGVRDGGSVHQMNRLTSDGSILDFQKDGSTVGSIKSRSGLVSTIILDPRTASNGGTGLTATGGASAPALLPTDEDGTVQDDHVNLGASGAAFKDLYLSGGVYLGGTGSANKLDDYEEGSFTPTLEDPDSGNAVSSYYYRTGKYVKVGSVVHISITISPANMGTLTNSSDDIHITGLPFASRGNIPNDTQVLPISSFNSGSYSYVVARLAQNSTQLEIRNIYASGGGWNFVHGGEIGAGGQQIVTATYLTDA
jgi:hypothetical protein